MATFPQVVNQQIANEFGASQQYIAIAVHYDAETLPQLAAHLSFMNDGLASHSPAAIHEAQEPDLSRSSHAGPSGAGGATLQPHERWHSSSMNAAFALHSPAAAHDGQLSP